MALHVRKGRDAQRRRRQGALERIRGTKINGDSDGAKKHNARVDREIEILQERIGRA